MAVVELNGDVTILCPRHTVETVSCSTAVHRNRCGWEVTAWRIGEESGCLEDLRLVRLGDIRGRRVIPKPGESYQFWEVLY